MGHTNPSEALRRHVPEDMRTTLETLISREGWLVPPGQGLKKSMTMLSLGGLIRLVNGCVKRECEPFKNWITEVVVEVQREGFYTLEKAEVQPREPDAPTAYAMPAEVADAIVRLEEHNLRMDEEWLAQRREERRFESGVTAAHQEMLVQHPRCSRSTGRSSACWAGSWRTRIPGAGRRKRGPRLPPPRSARRAPSRCCRSGSGTSWRSPRTCGRWPR
ncbi:hypothetical protein DQ392_18605 [Streptomyces reniochalinae]|uniref:Bro-N domain-containing protein n=1 Tax=Streptomyces reniochalinae TaxID=2250578 RepID=A0A367EG42_9ACTN|nr:hypothetical protein DQ392_18605 [Streptomyces reniochalinae]